MLYHLPAGTMYKVMSDVNAVDLESDVEYTNVHIKRMNVPVYDATPNNN